MLLIELARRLNEKKIPYAVVGGFALALQGIVRATMDVDIVVSLKESHLKSIVALLSELGLESRLPITASEMSKFHKEYRTKRNLIAWTFVDFKNPSRQVDLLIEPPLTAIRTENIPVQGIPVKVATKSALIKMKKVSNRPIDLIDIKRLEEAIREKNR